MTDRLYFHGHGFANVLYEGFETTGSETFDCFLGDCDWCDILNDVDDDFDWEGAEFDGINILGNYGRRKEWVYNISEDWRHKVFHMLVEDVDVDVVEKIIGEMGIRKVMKIVIDSEFYKDGLPELWTDMGIRQVFYNLLDYFVNINDEHYKEITRDEYDEWVAQHIENDDEEDEEDEEDEDAIVPITDEAFVRIGGGVAPCA